MEEFLQVGVISSTHGIAGEVKVFPTTDDVKRFKKLKEVILDTGKERMTLHICQVKFFKQMVIPFAVLSILIVRDYALKELSKKPLVYYFSLR